MATVIKSASGMPGGFSLTTETTKAGETVDYTDQAYKLWSVLRTLPSGTTDRVLWALLETYAEYRKHGDTDGGAFWQQAADKMAEYVRASKSGPLFPENRRP